jgi:hypothetical protein
MGFDSVSKGILIHCHRNIHKEESSLSSTVPADFEPVKICIFPAENSEFCNER